MLRMFREYPPALGGSSGARACGRALIDPIRGRLRPEQGAHRIEPGRYLSDVTFNPRYVPELIPSRPSSVLSNSGIARLTYTS